MWLIFNKGIYPPPSNSDHQDASIFSRGFLETRNLPPTPTEKTLPETNKWHQKRKRNDRLPTIHFLVLLVLVSGMVLPFFKLENLPVEIRSWQILQGRRKLALLSRLPGGHVRDVTNGPGFFLLTPLKGLVRGQQENLWSDTTGIGKFHLIAKQDHSKTYRLVPEIILYLLDVVWDETQWSVGFMGDVHQHVRVAASQYWWVIEITCALQHALTQTLTHVILGVPFVQELVINSPWIMPVFFQGNPHPNAIFSREQGLVP